MISYIRGELVALEEDKAIVDVGGVGYGIFMSGQAILCIFYKDPHLSECQRRCYAAIWIFKP